MDVAVKPDGDGRYVVTCPQDMQWQARQQLLEVFIASTAGADVRGVIVDLDGVTYISSAGLGGIFSLRKHVSSLGARMVIARPSVSLQRLLRTVNIEALIPVKATMADARAEVSKPAEPQAD